MSTGTDEIELTTAEELAHLSERRQVQASRLAGLRARLSELAHGARGAAKAGQHDRAEELLAEQQSVRTELDREERTDQMLAELTAEAVEEAQRDQWRQEIRELEAERDAALAAAHRATDRISELFAEARATAREGLKREATAVACTRQLADLRARLDAEPGEPPVITKYVSGGPTPVSSKINADRRWMRFSVICHAPADQR